MKAKRAQVTIFIIVAILIVVAILAIFFLTGEADIDEPTDISPKNIIDKCVRDVVEESIEKVMLNGGEATPSQPIMYQGDPYNYLCYQADFYQGCYNIHPMLERQIENEIFEDTRLEVQGCFDSMREELENQGYVIGGGGTTYSINLLPGHVAVNLQKRIDATSPTGATQSLEDFDTRVMSPLYDLVLVAREVVNGESQFCNFEYNGYVLLYPQYDIRRIDYRDSKIYRLIDRRSTEEFRFAVRSCAFAHGV